MELYSACEAMALTMSALIWATPSSEEQSRRRYLTLQRWWAAVLLGGAIRLFSLRIDFDEGDAPRGARRLDLDYVVKRELLWSPSLDVIGNRLCNAFGLRDGTDTARVVWRTRASRASRRSVRCCGRIWWDVGLRWLRGGFDVRRCPRVLRRGSIGGWASIERGRRLSAGG